MSNTACSSAINDSITYKVAQLVEEMRASAPLVHCLTNTVVNEITANVLLAAGAAPAMVIHEEETFPFAQIANGLLINVGTLSIPTNKAIRSAIQGAHAANTPWVLDPVAVGGLVPRTKFAKELRSLRPTVIRGNASEIIALAGFGEGGRGTDTTERVETAIQPAQKLAHHYGCIVAISGERDVVVSTDRITWVHGGHPVMTKITGMGCSLGALTAAYVGSYKTKSPTTETLHYATVAAHLHVKAAGTLASQTSILPGSFKVAFLDALSSLTPPTIQDNASCSE